MRGTSLISHRYVWSKKYCGSYDRANRSSLNNSSHVSLCSHGLFCVCIPRPRRENTFFFSDLLFLQIKEEYILLRLLVLEQSASGAGMQSLRGGVVKTTRIGSDPASQPCLRYTKTRDGWEISGERDWIEYVGCEPVTRPQHPFTAPSVAVRR